MGCVSSNSRPELKDAAPPAMPMQPPPPISRSRNATPVTAVIQQMHAVPLPARDDRDEEHADALTVSTPPDSPSWRRKQRLLSISPFEETASASQAAGTPTLVYGYVGQSTSSDAPMMSPELVTTTVEPQDAVANAGRPYSYAAAAFRRCLDDMVPSAAYFMTNGGRMNMPAVPRVMLSVSMPPTDPPAAVADQSRPSVSVAPRDPSPPCVAAGDTHILQHQPPVALRALEPAPRPANIVSSLRTAPMTGRLASSATIPPDEVIPNDAFPREGLKPFVGRPPLVDAQKERAIRSPPPQKRPPPRRGEAENRVPSCDQPWTCPTVVVAETPSRQTQRGVTASSPKPGTLTGRKGVNIQFVCYEDPRFASVSRSPERPRHTA